MKRDPSVLLHPTDPAGLDLTGRHVAVIGGTGGIGRAFARAMAARGAQVLTVGRTFRDPGVPGITFLPADLSLLREAHRVGAELPAEQLDLVLFTTGIIAGPTRQQVSEGIERDLAVSYLSRLVIVRGIGARLGRHRTGAPAAPRVFVMGFPGAGQTGAVDDLNAEASYRPMAVHANTVAGNEILVLDAARRYPGTGYFGLNPGFIKSGIRGNLLGAGSFRHRLLETTVGLVTPSADAYAVRLTPVLLSADLEGRTGIMIDRKGRAVLPTAANTDPRRVDGYLAASAELVARAGVQLSG